MPKGSKKRQAKSKKSKNPMPKTLENGYLGDISNLPNADRRQSFELTEDLKVGKRVYVEEMEVEVKENENRTCCDLVVLNNFENGKGVSEQFMEKFIISTVGEGMKKVVSKDLGIGLSGDDEGSDCYEEARVANDKEELVEQVIEEAKDSCEAEDCGEMKVGWSSEHLVSSVVQVVDDGTYSFNANKPVEESVNTVQQGDGEASDSSIEKSSAESIVHVEMIITEGGDSSVVEASDKVKDGTTTGETVTPVKQVIDEGKDFCETEAYEEPEVDKTVTPVQQVDVEASDSSIKKSSVESIVHVEMIITEGGESSVVEASDISKDETTTEETVTPVKQIIDQGKDYCETEAYEEPEVDKTSVVAVLSIEQVNEKRDCYKPDAWDDAGDEKHMDEIISSVEHSAVEGEDCCETNTHEEAKVEKAIEEEREDFFEVMTHEEMKVEKPLAESFILVEQAVEEGLHEEMKVEKPLAESFILVEQAVEEGLNSCEVEASVDAKFEKRIDEIVISIEQAFNEERASYSCEAEACQEMEAVKHVNESVTPGVQFVDEHMDSWEADAFAETKVQKPFEDLVAFVEQAFDEARTSCEAEVCQEEENVELSEEIVSTTEQVVNEGRDSCVNESRDEMKVVKCTEELMVVDEQVFAGAEHENQEDLERKMASLDNCLKQSKELDFKAVLSIDVGKSVSQPSKTCGTSDDKRKGDTSPVTKVIPHAPLVVRRTTWWNFCGLIDLFMGSEK